MTCLQHDLPRAMLACTVLVDSSAYEPTLALRQGFPFYVQTNKTTDFPLEAWNHSGSATE